MTADVLFAYDLGTGGCKAAAVAADGAVLARAFVGYPTLHPAPGFHEQRPEDWWDAMVRATGQLLADPALAGRRVAGIGLSGQSLALVPVDGSGQLLTAQVPIWSDARADREAAELFTRVDEVDWYRTTGNGFPPPLYTVFEAAWLRRTDPETFARTAVLLGSKDWVNLRLTGTVATDPSYASGSGVFDLVDGRYDATLLAAADLPATLWPTVRPADEVVGELRPDAAQQLGLPVGTPVVTGGVDNACMALGAGCVEGGATYVSLGSSNWLTVGSDRPLLDVPTRPFVFAHVVPDRFISALSTFGGGSTMAWLGELLDRRPTDLEQAAADVPVGARGLLCLPTLAGGTVLEGGPQVRGAFLGLGLEHGAGELARAVTDGIVLALRRAGEVLGDLTQLGASVRAVGGGSRSDLLLQSLADGLDTPVVRTVVDQDCAALGAAALAARGVGLWDDLAPLEAQHVVTATFEPRPAGRAAYAQLAEVHRHLSATAAELAGPLAAVAGEPTTEDPTQEPT